MDIHIPKLPRRVRKEKPDFAVLRSKDEQEKFAEVFHERFQSSPISTHTHENGVAELNELNDRITSAFKTATDEMIPSSSSKRSQPWISEQTLVLIEKRQECRRSGNWEEEKELNKKIKHGAREDRKRWILHMLEEGDWAAIKRYRKGFQPKLGRMRNMEGNLVDSTQKSETMAQYFESVQWKTPFPDIVPPATPKLGDTLRLKCSYFTKSELIAAIAKLRNSRAAGPDGIPGECWKALLTSDSAIE
eukprot:8786310-Karenia_brevis.AAC.1